jgi:hypothetical protein
MFSFITRLFRTSPARRPGARPKLESLEARWVPAAFVPGTESPPVLHVEVAPRPAPMGILYIDTNASKYGGVLPGGIHHGDIHATKYGGMIDPTKGATGDSGPSSAW